MMKNVEFDDECFRVVFVCMFEIGCGYGVLLDGVLCIVLVEWVFKFFLDLFYFV